MRLPKNILSNTYRKPDVYLCEVDKTKICKLDTSNMQATLKFNSYSELSFEIGRTYNDILTGAVEINPYYDLIEALRLVYVEGFGYFEIQGPELIGDGIKEAKSVTAYSYEYTLSQKYLEEFYVNTGETKSIEVINASSENNIVPVTLYNSSNKKRSLLHLIFEKDYAGWKIGHVDPQLQTLSRQFEVDRESIYDFLMNEVCEKFNCYIVFDTINNEINVYAESPTEKFVGDGKTNRFTCTNAFSSINTVSINGYKTTQWSYDGITLVLTDIPESGAMIEVVGEDSNWETDVFITFDNLSQEIKVDYDADSIKTVLTVTFGDDNDIREVNLGLPYIVDLSYYTTPEWMGQDLYDDWLAYQEKCNSKQAEYTKNTQDMLYYAGQIDREESRLSLGYAEITVDENSVGKYYVRGGTHPNYYYTEVSLPAEYKVNTTYYSTRTTNLEDGADGNVAHLYEALKKYFMNADDWKKDLDILSGEFDFMGSNAIANLSKTLSGISTDRILNDTVSNALDTFFVNMWNELGRIPLKQMFYEPYKKVQITNMEAGWSQKGHAEYGNYYAVILILSSIEKAISERDTIIKEYELKYKNLQDKNTTISNELLMENNFTKGQLVRLNAFLREDELHLDDIITTSQDSIADTYKNQQDAMESGRIELKKISQPQLQFSMSMANIYALPEFEPIVDQFELGKTIKVEIRPGYIKQSRLMQVNLNFEDFSDFSCEFSELTSIRNQSDIHADLLKNAISAGKSVAQNASYWTKGSDQATSTDLKIQQGLLDVATAIKSIDGLQEVSVDNYGIHLRKKKFEGSEEYDDKQGWIVNNQFLYSDDAFKTTKSVFGEYKVPTSVDQDGNMQYENMWGLLAEAVIAGYIEGSQIVGGTIKIGEFYEDNTKKYRFSVDESGNVILDAASISGYVTTGNLNSAITQTKEAITSQIENIEEGLSSKIEQTEGSISSQIQNIESGFNSKIEQAEDRITSEIGATYATKGQANYYGNCDTASDVAIKEVKCDNFPEKPIKGTTITVLFTNANTANKPCLKINSFEDDIAIDGHYLYSSSYANWSKNSRVCFVYNGSYWDIVDSGAYSKIEQTAESITSTVEDKFSDYSTTTEMNSAITQSANSITSTVSSTYATKGSVNTLSSKIDQAAETIKLAVTKSELKNGSYSDGTSFEINSNAVKIAWNKNSNYVQFENGAMCIYTSSSHTNNTLLMKQTYNGIWYYRDGATLGHIGTNNFASDSNFRGIVFDLEYNGNYMCWAAQDSSDTNTYAVKMIYYNKDTAVHKKGLHFDCSTYVNSGLYLTNEDRFLQWSGGGCGYNGYMSWCNKQNVNVVSIDTPNKSINVFNNVNVKFYTNIDMNNYSILNQSDARLKTNINNTQVDALSVINRIEMKEFDWIENGEHEDIGIIAQQLQTILPDMVYEDDRTGKLSIKTIKLIPYLIKSIQELTEYVTGGVSTFSLRNGWVDLYTEDEKAEFTLYNSCHNKNETLEEAKNIEILLPIEPKRKEAYDE